MAKSGRSSFVQMHFQVQGSDELRKQLTAVTNRRLTQIMRTATTFAATPANRAMKRRAPKETGALKLALTKKTKSYEQSASAVTIVGTDKNFTLTVRRKGGRIVKAVPYRYLHLVELGHRIAHGGRLKRKDGKSRPGPAKGKHIGNVPGAHFMSAAWKETQREAADRLKAKIGELVMKEYEKRGRA